jgi:RNA polymerase sigma-70 factor (ECF subfamily)
MQDRDRVAREFERCRPQLKAAAYRMLGSLTEADDAVQECWLRLDRNDSDGIDDLRAWLTTVVGRICLDMLRARRARRDEYVGTWLPEPVVTDQPGADPENEALIADSVGLALLVVLDTLGPAERVAFVLHDVFALGFDEIGPIVGRSPAASRQLASRARRRVREAAPAPETDPIEQRRVVDAFLAAARSGDFEALLEVLDPDVVFRADRGPNGPRLPTPLSGARAVALQVLFRGTRLASIAQPVLVNGAAGVVVGDREAPIAVVGFSVARGRIVSIDLVADPAKIRRLDVRNE